MTIYTADMLRADIREIVERGEVDHEESFYGKHVVYVVAFSDGLVKVGHTTDFETRQKAHTRVARRYGHTPSSHWAAVTASALEDEQVLIQLAMNAGGKPKATSKEWFTNVDVDALMASVERAKAVAA